MVVDSKPRQNLFTLKYADANSLRIIRHGAQGTFDAASKSTLENEFGTTKDDEVVAQILEKGSVQESEVRIDSFSYKLPTHIPFYPALEYEAS